MTTEFFKTKKIFLLSVAIPIVLFVRTYLGYKKRPGDCSGSFDIDIFTKCENFSEYLSNFSGIIQVFGIIVSFLVSLFAIASIFFFLNGRKTLGNICLVLLILCLFFVYIVMFGIY